MLQHLGDASKVIEAEASPQGAAGHVLQAVVSVLDTSHHGLIAALWNEIREAFKIMELYETPIPHVSYHVAQAYEAEALDAILQEYAQEWPPFLITTSGLGLFTGQQPVLYVSVVRTVQLSAFQDGMFRRLQPIALRPVSHYSPENWMPHITLTLGNVNQKSMAAIAAHLCRRNFQWRIPIGNVTTICDQCGMHGINAQYTLTGEPRVRNDP